MKKNHVVTATVTAGFIHAKTLDHVFAATKKRKRKRTMTHKHGHTPGVPVRTWVVFVKSNGLLDAIAIGEKFAWMAMCGKHYIVQSQSRDNAIEAAEEKYSKEQEQ